MSSLADMQQAQRPVVLENQKEFETRTLENLFEQLEHFEGQMTKTARSFFAMKRLADQYLSRRMSTEQGARLQTKIANVVSYYQAVVQNLDDWKSKELREILENRKKQKVERTEP